MPDEDDKPIAPTPPLPEEPAPTEIDFITSGRDPEHHKPAKTETKIVEPEERKK